MLEGTCLNACAGGVYSADCRSLGMITTVGALRVIAVRNARSIALGSCSGTFTSTRYSLATSLNSACRSTSCWYAPPIALRSVCPTIATTGTWSSLAS